MTAPEPKNELSKLRLALDDIDTRVVDLLADRFEITRRVGELKAGQGLDPVDSGRERELLNLLRGKALNRELDPDLIETIYRIIIAEVVVGHRLIQSRSDDKS